MTDRKTVRYIVKRHCATGVNEYLFYRDGEEEKIGKAISYLFAHRDIHMSCAGLMLNYSKDPAMTLVPGMSIPILEVDSGKEYARVFWDDIGTQRLHTPFGNFQIEYREGIYIFGRNNICIAGICIIQKGSPYNLAHQESQDPYWEDYMALETNEEIPDELALLMMSFPLL